MWRWLGEFVGDSVRTVSNLLFGESPLDAEKCTIKWDHGDHQKVGDLAVITVEVCNFYSL